MRFPAAHIVLDTVRCICATGARIAIALVMVLAVGCIRIPPAQIQATATDYNIVLQRTSDEQLLLNLVRLRYHEPPFFMEPTAVSAQLRRSAELSAQAGITDANVTERNLGIGGRLGFSETPTLTFVPLRGEAFMARILSRLDLQTLLLLYHSGWDIERVFRLCVRSLNQVVNRPPASGSRRDDIQKDPFYTVMHLLRNLERTGAIDLGYTSNAANAPAVISLAGEDAEPTNDLRQRLRLAPELSEYRLELGTIGEAKDPSALVIGTRSLMGILFFLSHAVEVPPSDAEREVAAVTRDTDGIAINSSEVTGGTFRVKVSDTAPPAETTRTFYRNHWFYIDDTDLESKSTLTLLSQLFSIQSGMTSSFAPVLTLPAGDAP